MPKAKAKRPKKAAAPPASLVPAPRPVTTNTTWQFGWRGQTLAQITLSGDLDKIRKVLELWESLHALTVTATI